MPPNQSESWKIPCACNRRSISKCRQKLATATWMQPEKECEPCTVKIYRSMHWNRGSPTLTPGKLCNTVRKNKKKKKETHKMEGERLWREVGDAEESGWKWETQQAATGRTIFVPMPYVTERKLNQESSGSQTFAHRGSSNGHKADHRQRLLLGFNPRAPQDGRHFAFIFSFLSFSDWILVNITHPLFVGSGTTLKLQNQFPLRKSSPIHQMECFLITGFTSHTHLGESTQKEYGNGQPLQKTDLKLTG